MHKDATKKPTTKPADNRLGVAAEVVDPGPATGLGPGIGLAGAAGARGAVGAPAATGAGGFM
jgi:hypothetical protein